MSVLFYERILSRYPPKNTKEKENHNITNSSNYKSSFNISYEYNINMVLMNNFDKDFMRKLGIR